MPRCLFRSFLTPLFLFCLVPSAKVYANFQSLSDSYIQAWVDYYPSSAFSEGLVSAAFEFEDFSQDKVEKWLAYNHKTIKALSSPESGLSLDERIDARVLLRQAKLEVERWEKEQVHVNQSIWYAELISQALTYILVREQLSSSEKARALSVRLKGVSTLCDLAIKTLQNGSPQRTERSLKVLSRTASFYEKNLPEIITTWVKADQAEQLTKEAHNTAAKIRRLHDAVRDQILPKASIPDSFGYEDYARRLAITVDSDITPEQLAKIALEEINLVRKLMSQESQRWWNEEKKGEAIPASEDELLNTAMNAMEDYRADNRKDFLALFVDLTQEAEDFIIEHDLATVPQPRTLYIGLSPDHFSGAAYGGVYPTGPFSPDLDTLFLLPTVPDDTPKEQKTGFYRSFNNHFNTMIIAHEMLPGHYMQYKVAVNEASRVRTLFANYVYVEGWGTFSEELMLDAGFGDGNRLTRLAHLRKRLENATRAYVSVTVHTQDWDKERLMKFAVERGLLAPQFAINLWNRAINNPLQIPSYFLGFHEFRKLWKSEQARLGEKFTTRKFVDGVLHAGPVPMDVLASTLK